MTTHSIGVPVTVMYLVFRSFVLDLAACEKGKFHAFADVRGGRRTGRCIDDHQERSHEREENDRGSKDRPGGPTLD